VMQTAGVVVESSVTFNGKVVDTFTVTPASNTGSFSELVEAIANVREHSRRFYTTQMQESTEDRLSRQDETDDALALEEEEETTTQDDRPAKRQHIQDN